MGELEEIKQEKMNQMKDKEQSLETESKIDVNDNNFEKEVIERSKEIPVVLDLWAPWCGPCRMIGPVLERLVEKDKSKFILAKLNVDENPIMSQKYDVKSIPSVKLFKDGKLLDEFIGAIPEPAIRDWINKNLN